MEEKMIRKAKKIEKKEEKKDDSLADIQKKHDELLNGIASKLLSKTALRRGGSDVRARHMKEKGYETLLPKLNGYRKQLGLGEIGLGHLRKD